MQHNVSLEMLYEVNNCSTVKSCDITTKQINFDVRCDTTWHYRSSLLYLGFIIVLMQAFHHEERHPIWSPYWFRFFHGVTKHVYKNNNCCISLITKKTCYKLKHHMPFWVWSISFDKTLELTRVHFSNFPCSKKFLKCQVKKAVLWLKFGAWNFSVWHAVKQTTFLYSLHFVWIKHQLSLFYAFYCQCSCLNQSFLYRIGEVNISHKNVLS